MCNRIVRTNAIGSINVETSNTCVMGDLQQVCGIRRVEPSDDKDEIQAIFFRFLYEFRDSILTFLNESEKMIVREIRFEHRNKPRHTQTRRSTGHVVCIWFVPVWRRKWYRIQRSADSLRRVRISSSLPFATFDQ